jgi:hypothetical protein
LSIPASSSSRRFSRLFLDSLVWKNKALHNFERSLTTCTYQSARRYKNYDRNLHLELCAWALSTPPISPMWLHTLILRYIRNRKFSHRKYTCMFLIELCVFRSYWRVWNGLRSQEVFLHGWSWGKAAFSVTGVSNEALSTISFFFSRWLRLDLNDLRPLLSWLRINPPISAPNSWDVLL